MLTKHVLEIAALAAEILLSSGAEIYRVEYTAKKICKSYGVECECFVMPTGFTISCMGDENEMITYVKRIENRTIDLHRIDSINAFSRRLESKKLNYEEAIKQLKNIEGMPYFSQLTRCIAAGLIAFSFTMLFKGTEKDGIVAFFISMLILKVKNEIESIGFFQFFEYFISGMIAGGISVIAGKFSPDFNIDKIIIGSIMILVPGVSITNGIKDALYGDLISSFTRLGEALFISIAVGVGVGIMLTLNMYWM
ncbi:threonine/serine exporter family protein [Caloramator sp. E03]|uniref:threonine/serine ThrE exporter family protein n=1 Tax=Caloramator sp. E03 TaxID=2576307 RepID=UPI0011105832|nr:threonine/serine exporter family protein [Caloramator sp. E03]QCX33319.1 threonine/serine exporter family protein [Caloramator sp. E03]